MKEFNMAIEVWYEGLEINPDNEEMKANILSAKEYKRIPTTNNYHKI